jgi:hypothetical protein
LLAHGSAVHERIPDHFYLFVRFAHHAVLRPNLESDIGRAYKDLHVELSTIVLSANTVPVSYLVSHLKQEVASEGNPNISPMFVSECESAVINTRLQYT